MRKQKDMKETKCKKTNRYETIKYVLSKQNEKKIFQEKKSFFLFVSFVLFLPNRRQQKTKSKTKEKRKEKKKKVFSNVKNKTEETKRRNNETKKKTKK